MKPKKLPKICDQCGATSAEATFSGKIIVQKYGRSKVKFQLCDNCINHNKKTHGGARPGAGRKATRPDRKPLLVEVKPKTIDTLKGRKKSLGLSSIGAVLDNDYEGKGEK